MLWVAPEPCARRAPPFQSPTSPLLWARAARGGKRSAPRRTEALLDVGGAALQVATERGVTVLAAVFHGLERLHLDVHIVALQLLEQEVFELARRIDRGEGDLGNLSVEVARRGRIV
eukprot:430704-Prymnesium_polylepis.1